MQLISGQTLVEILLKNQSCSLGRCMEWFRQLASALAHVHERGVLHRDIKPSDAIHLLGAINRALEPRNGG